jgi:small ligand-binding sensory domain FIST
MRREGAMMESVARLAQDPQWSEALKEINLGENDPSPAPDLAIFFASPEHTQLPELVETVWRRSGASVMIGCTGQGVIGGGREVESAPALSMMSLALPGARLHPRHVEYSDIQGLGSPAAWQEWLGLSTEEVNAFLVIADPFTFDAQELIDGLTMAYPHAPVVGGLASGRGSARGTHVFFNGEVHASGAIVMALGGAYTVRSVVAQGATPIGETWTITDVEQNVLRTIGNRPTLEVLNETLRALPMQMQRRAAQNLLVGLAMNEYKDSFRQGDFLIRNLIGADRESGAVAIGALPQVGQTIQFQIRDAEAADQDLKRSLDEAREDLGDTQVAGGILCTCNGRGIGLFGQPDHDASAIVETLGDIPLAGFFCNGEIGPVGGKTYLHGFTASLALFVPVASPG